MKMMKIKPLLPILFLLLCGAKPRYTITPSMEMGPYTKYQADPTVSYTIKSTYTTEQSIYEIFRFGDQNNPNQRTVTKATHTIPAQGTYSGAITIPTSTFLSEEGMSITIQLYWSAGSIMREKSFIIYPMKQETINPVTYHGTYTCPQTHMVMTNSIVHFTEETYSFPKIDDYFLTDLYYRLPIEQFVIQTSLSEEEFTYSSAYLRIDGLSEYFPSLTYRRGIASIPLDVNYSGGLLTLSFKNSLYVEPTMLYMSTNAKPNYRSTNNFYFPVNHAKDLVGELFSFSINQVGYSKTTFYWQTSLFSESPLIGDCQNSGYCVVGTLHK